ncbi:MAG: peptidoglycan-binding domain-containing protein [Candidatus Electrothrix aestuarii]|uniref:Peptidoglycan-binding domain-containing protein n=1 Tax=Candidatus Electrothrix aestuarii TaxID=3062594 RepID=A0AAU8LS45_9BACT|nr:peptidoglycan-binding domain-containing protein [Candidatus Electrothrix aestuarii]
MSRINGYYQNFNDPAYQTLNREINGLLGDLPFFYQVPPELFSSDIPSTEKAPFFDFRHELSKTSQENALGLRLYIIPPEINPRRASQHLAQSGLIKTGDILLSFRQGTTGTGEYQHIQLGLTHSGLALVKDGALYNVDSPLSFCSQLDHEHYTEDQLMLHVLRPHLSDAERGNLQHWLELAYNNKTKLSSRIGFNSDYGKPKSAHGHKKEVFNLGKLLVSHGTKGHDTAMYCSEFVWHVLALRGCDPTDATIREQFMNGTHDTFPGQLTPLFDPMPVLGNVLLEPKTGAPGLSDGIGLVLNSLEIGAEQVDTLLNKAFSEWEPHFSGGRPPYSISSGHREQARKFEPLYDPLKAYFRAAKLAPATAAQIKAQLDQQLQGQDNYSPTAYLVQALLPETSTRRVLSYVGTVSFPTSQQISLIEKKFPEQLRHMLSMRPETLSKIADRPALEYKDGFRGERFFKRPQVKKLQCMLNHLGYNTGDIDGLYGNKTTLAVRKCLNENSMEGDGRSLSQSQWAALEKLAGSACNEYGVY